MINSSYDRSKFHQSETNRVSTEVLLHTELALVKPMIRWYWNLSLTWLIPVYIVRIPKTIFSTCLTKCYLKCVRFVILASNGSFKVFQLYKYNKFIEWQDGILKGTVLKWFMWVQIPTDHSSHAFGFCYTPFITTTSKNPQRFAVYFAHKFTLLSLSYLDSGRDPLLWSIILRYIV